MPPENPETKSTRMTLLEPSMGLEFRFQASVARERIAGHSFVSDFDLAGEGNGVYPFIKTY